MARHVAGGYAPPLGAAGRAVLALAVGALALSGCGTAHRMRGAVLRQGGPALAALVRERRPLGRGPRFHPPARGRVPGACRPRLGPRYGVHVELFAENRVVLIAAGIGLRGPRRLTAGRITGASCYGALVTLEPTGVALVRPGRTPRLGDLFEAWGQPVSSRRIASFVAPRGQSVRVYLGGRRWRGAPGSVPLSRHAEIVLEVGPPVAPHRRYTFAPGA